MMEKPFAVCHMFTALNGKIDGGCMTCPEGVIGTYDGNGNADAMNAAWGGLYDRDKVVLCLSAGRKTAQNIKVKGAFAVSFADAAHVAEADYVGLAPANQEPDKLKRADAARSGHVDAPLIEEFPVALKRGLIKVNEDGSLIGRIVDMSVDESVLGADGRIDAAKLQAVSFDPCGNTYVKMGEVTGKAFQASGRLK